ncbi:MAG: tRNA pseudouridine(38-40) synthase TruA [Candidatus Omnitrophica bacterium]|nr:tRNA pseudouridine(38-40) synthase TruA [Candidatus Omnitrophota bacterium]
MARHRKTRSIGSKDGKVNFKLTIAYDGANYNGWQVQNRHRGRMREIRTVQGTIEDALDKIFSTKVRLISSSRTDSGVHAEGHVANFTINSMLTPEQLKRAVNSILPTDILVKSVKKAKIDFNAQFDSRSKVYRYVIYNGDYVPPVKRNYVYHCKQRLDVGLMKREARGIIGTRDFAAFRSSCGKHNRRLKTNRTVKRLDVTRKGSYITIDIEADGYLYNMVRNIVGTLLEVGRGKFKPGASRVILRSRDRRKAGPAVPSKGLCLIKVKY